MSWDMMGTFVRQSAAFVISIFLARLLDPTEFGLIGMSLVFISVSQVFVDVGFTSALIQNQTNTKLTYSSVFYLNLLAGLLLTCIFYFAAPLVGAFYSNIQITNLVRWLSLIFVFNSLSLVQMTILRKELSFRILTLRNIIATIIGGAIGIGGAFLGYGVYSLVAQQLATAFVATVLLWSASSWSPSFSFSKNEVKKLFGFSSFVFLDRFTSVLSQKLDTLFIGKYFSPGILGFYSRAESLNMQVTTYTSTSLSKVFFPVLSGLQNDHEKFTRVYFRVISVVCFLSFLIAGILYIVAEPLVLGLFGEKWMFSVVLFQIIIFKSFNVPLNAMMINAMLSQGMSKENFYIGLIRKLVRATPIIVGVFFGLIPFVWAVTGVSYLLTIFNTFFIKKYLHINMWFHLRKIFEGIVPIILIVAVVEFMDSSLLINFFQLISFIVIYFIYGMLIKMEGLMYLKEEVFLRLKRF